MSQLKKFFFNLHNYTILFQIKNYIFVTYGAFLGLACFSAISVALYYNMITGLDIYAIAKFYVFILLPAIFIGVRTLNIIQILLSEPKLIRERRLLSVIFSPGFNIQGGILFGALIIIFYGWLNNVSALQIGDGVVLGTALAEAIGRLGCYSYGCCWGKPTTNKFSISYYNNNAKIIRTYANLAGLKLHPAQLYTAFSSLILFIFLAILTYWVTFDGVLVSSYLILHGIIRILIDFIRDDPRGVIYKNILLSTVMAINEIAIGIFLGIFARIVKDPIHFVKGSWSDIYGQPPIFALIMLCSLLAAIFYGSHYKKVGLWVSL